MHCDLGRCRLAAVLVFNLPILEPTVTNGDTMGHADQLPVGEHRTRPLTAVIQDHIDTGLQQLRVQGLGRRLGLCTVRSPPSAGA